MSESQNDPITQDPSLTDRLVKSAEHTESVVGRLRCGSYSLARMVQLVYTS